MKTSTTNEKIFVGQPFSPEIAGETGSFLPAYQQVISDENFNKFSQTNKLAQNIASLVIFGPESYQYWLGTIYDGDAEIPAGFFKYVLPKSDVAVEQQAMNESYFAQPLTVIIPSLIDQAKNAGIKVPANMGLSQKPFILTVFDQNKNELTSEIFLSDEIADVDD